MGFFPSLFIFPILSFFFFFFYFFPLFPAQQPSYFPGHWKWDRMLWAMCPTEWNCFVHMHWCSLGKEIKKASRRMQKWMFFILSSKFNKTNRLQTSFVFEIFHIRSGAFCYGIWSFFLHYKVNVYMKWFYFFIWNGSISAMTL